MDLPHNQHTRQSIDQYSKFLEPTMPKGQEAYYNTRKPLIAKELSVGNIERSDMIGNFDMEDAIMDFMEEGQIGLARFMMTRFQSEFKMSMSFEGRFMDQITTNKFEYTQRQDIHEHVEPVKKKGMWSKR